MFPSCKAVPQDRSGEYILYYIILWVTANALTFSSIPCLICAAEQCDLPQILKDASSMPCSFSRLGLCVHTNLWAPVSPLICFIIQGLICTIQCYGLLQLLQAYLHLSRQFFRIKVVKRYYPMTVVCVLICCNTEGFVTAAKDCGPKKMCDNKYWTKY